MLEFASPKEDSKRTRSKFMKVFKKGFPRSGAGLAFLIGALGLSLLFTSCSNSSDNSALLATLASQPKTEGKTIYKASANLSDYMGRVEKKLVSLKQTASAASDQAPDVFIVSGNEAQSLSDDQVRLAVLTCLQGKTLVFDSPTLDHISQFKAKIDSILQQEKNAALKAESALSPYSPYHFTEKATHAQESLQSSSSQEKPYDAIAARKDDFYIVYDIDKPMASQAGHTVENETYPNKGTGEEVVDNFTASDQSVHATYERLLSESSEKFAKWILDAEASATSAQKMNEEALAYLRKNVVQDAGEATLEIKKNAQVERRNFTVEFSRNNETNPRYDGRYNNKRKENVEISVYVWTVCDISSQTDWYLVKTSSTCRNEQLNWDTNDWGGRYPCVSPYFSFYTIDLEMRSAAGILDTAAPETTEGSSTFTRSVATNINATVGANAGPSYGKNGLGVSGGLTGSISTGITLSESTTTSIPDISVEYKKLGDRRPTWGFTTPHPTARDKNKGTSLKYDMAFDGIKPIQKNTAVFETLAIFSIPSGDATLDRDHIRLHLSSQLCLDIYCGEYSKYHYDYKGTIYGSLTKFEADIHIEKPCNAYRTYMMGFTPPTNLSPTDNIMLGKQLEEKCAEPNKKLWIGSATYYAVVTAAEYANETEKNKRIDEAAKAQFALVKNKITNNKSVFHDAGFRGKYTFYIQASDNDRQDQFEVDFGQ